LNLLAHWGRIAEAVPCAQLELSDEKRRRMACLDGQAC